MDKKLLDKKIAEKLIDELEGHSGIIKPERELFLNILVSAEIPDSSKFYENLPEKKQLSEEFNRYHYLSLRRVLRNRNARNYRLSEWKKAYEAIASAMRIYSSDSISRNLRANKDVVEMMAECREPYSLLGKFKIYDFNNPDKALFVISRPVLIIPGAKDKGPIYEWENDNTTHEEEVGIIFRHLKRINPQEYFCH